MAVLPEYVALETIQLNGVNAYQPGDGVHAAIVDGLGLIIGKQVEQVKAGTLDKPAKNASRNAWVAYALDQGLAPADVEDMGRDELVAYFDEDKPADGG